MGEGYGVSPNRQSHHRRRQATTSRSRGLDCHEHRALGEGEPCLCIRRRLHGRLLQDRHCLSLRLPAVCCNSSRGHGECDPHQLARVKVLQSPPLRRLLSCEDPTIRSPGGVHWPDFRNARGGRFRSVVRRGRFFRRPHHELPPRRTDTSPPRAHRAERVTS